MKQEQIWNKIALDWSKYRDKPVQEVIDFLKDKKGRLLDLGCGSGRNMIKQKDLEYYGLDFSTNMVSLAKNKAEKLGIKVRVSKENIEKLNFDDDFFDAAIFISTLHCIEGEKPRKKALQELYRVLRPNAEAMISVWDKSADLNISKMDSKEAFIEWKKGEEVFKRYYYFYDEDELTYLLNEIGFEILRIGKKEDTTKSDQHSAKNLIYYVQKN